MAPHEIDLADVRARERKVRPRLQTINENQCFSGCQVESFQNLKQQERFLGTAMGKGILLLSLSLIKYRSVKTSLVHSHWSRIVEAFGPF